MVSKINKKNIGMLLLGSAILAFGLYNIHSFSGITEGGVLGTTLLLHRWFGISPSISGLIMNLSCYVMGWKVLGKEFIIYSFAAGGGFSFFYAVFERFDPLWPQLADMPLVASIAGAAFVGIGVGICIRAGGAPGGDDALAMSLSKLTGMDIKWIYLICDLIVLVLSISYIPLRRICYSLLTVVLSGQIIGLVQKKQDRE